MPVLQMNVREEVGKGAKLLVSSREEWGQRCSCGDGRERSLWQMGDMSLPLLSRADTVVCNSLQHHSLSVPEGAPSPMITLVLSNNRKTEMKNLDSSSSKAPYGLCHPWGLLWYPWSPAPGHIKALGSCAYLVLQQPGGMLIFLAQGTTKDHINVLRLGLHLRSC